MTETTQESNANIKVYGGTIDELLALGYTLNSSMLGITYWNYYYEGYYLYGNSARLEARMSSAEICIMAKNKTADEYQNTCVHELGHALGFFGHSSSESAVMYPYGQSRYQLQTVEKNHLKQVYD